MQNFKKHSEEYLIALAMMVGIFCIFSLSQLGRVEAKKGEGIVYEPYSGVADHCVTDASGVTNRSLYDILQTIGTSKKATVKFKHDNESGNTTAYKVVSASGGNFASYSNVYFEFEPGAMLESGVTLSGVTLPGPSNVIAQPSQQIMSGTSLYFSNGGKAFVNWFGENSTPGTTDMGPAIQSGVSAFCNGGELNFLSGTTYNINTRVEVNRNNLSMNFGSSTITNTSAIALKTIYSESTYALINIYGSHVKLKGGLWRNIASEGIRVTGVFAGGDTYTGAGYIEDIKISDMTFDNCDLSPITVRFFSDCRITNITIRDKGDGEVAGHTWEIGLKYGTNATVSDCRVINSDEGGAFYGLYVSNYSVSNCIANDVTNSLAKQSCVPYYTQYSKYVNYSNNRAYLPDGGVGLKSSYSDVDVQVNNCEFDISGTSDILYAGILFQGTTGGAITNNKIRCGAVPAIYLLYHTVPAALNAKDILVEGNRTYTSYESGETKVTGTGLTYEADNGTTRSPVIVKNNYFYNGPAYMFQAYSAHFTGNTLLTKSDYGTQTAGIHFKSCSYSNIIGNNLMNEDDTDENKTGIKTDSCSVAYIANNVLTNVTPPRSGATAFMDIAGDTTIIFDGNYARFWSGSTQTSGTAVFNSNNVFQ